MRRWLLGPCLLLACSDPTFVDTELVRSTEWLAAASCLPAPAKVDVLLVIDDSASMGEHAEALASNLRGFALAYEAAGIDYRIAVTSTHVPGLDCSPGRGGGALVHTSCHQRLGDFVVEASAEGEASDLREVCEAHCDETTIRIAPSPDGPLARPRPWLERSGTWTNVDDPAEALACIGQLGVSGCAAESPLAAALRVLDRSEDPDDPAFGFVRPDAGLAIVFIGDEDDCSRPPDATESLGEGLGCWRAAARCEQVEQEVRCEPSGDPALLGLDVFSQRIAQIEADKRRIAGTDTQRVFVSAVTGVPSAYPEQQPVYDANDWGQGCIRAGRRAAPTVRLREIASSTDAWMQDLVSICVEDWRRVLACLPGGLPGGRDPQQVQLCLAPGPLGETDDPAEHCMAIERSGGASRRIPDCLEACRDVACEDASGWARPEGADACVFYERSDWCTDSERRHEAFILREGVAETLSCLEIRCSATL